VTAGTTASTNYHVYLSYDGNWGVNEANTELIMYAWKAVAGVSAFGSYTGTGGANTITYTGSNSFSARFIMIKIINTATSWVILDTFRDGPGELDTIIYPNNSNAEYTSSTEGITPTSTGFTMDAGSTAGHINTNLSTYIYAAFA